MDRVSQKREKGPCQVSYTHILFNNCFSSIQMSINTGTAKNKGHAEKILEDIHSHDLHSSDPKIHKMSNMYITGGISQPRGSL